MERYSIDVITVTYNNLKGLTKTYNSLKNLNYAGYEWIIVDGGSTDGSLEFFEMIGEDFNNLKVISEPDQGIYDAMNKGIDEASGDYLIFLNAGDEFNDDQVLNEVFKQVKEAPDLVFGNFYRERRDGSFSPVSAKPLFYIYHSLPTSHQAIFYKTDVVKKIKYDLIYRICGDYFLTSKVVVDCNLLQNKNYLVVSNFISRFEYNGVSRKNLDLLFQESSLIQKKVFTLPVFLRFISYYVKYIRNSFL